MEKSKHRICQKRGLLEIEISNVEKSNSWGIEQFKNQKIGKSQIEKNREIENMKNREIC